MTQQEETEIPKGWERTLVGSFLKLKNGYAFKSADYVEAGEDTVPVIRISDVKVDGANSDKANHVPACKAVEGFEIEKGDQLIAMSGATTGKVGVYQGETPAYQNQRVGNLKLISDENFNKQFKNYLIKAKSQAILDVAYGGAQPNVSARGIEEIEVLIPPLPEQKRIVEKLDSLLAQVDTIQQRLNNLPDIIKRFRQSVLAAAVSGKLTEQWRGESGQTLKKQESALIKFRDKALTELPSTWSWRRFDEVASIKSNLVDPLLSPDDVHIAPNHIQANEGKLLEFATVSKDGVKSNKHRFYPGQILYSKIRPYLCKVVIVDFEGVCSADMYPVETELETKFMFNWMLSFQFTEWASNGDSRTVLPKINQKQLSEIPTPVPPAAEQTEIVRLVEQYFALADTLEKNLANAKQRVDNLTQSILAKAFRGELVPQDPNDEPADKLLARIKAARLEAEKLEKAAKKAAKASKK